MGGVEEGGFAESGILEAATGEHQVVQPHALGQYEAARFPDMAFHRDVLVLAGHAIGGLDDDFIHLTQREVFFRVAGETEKAIALAPIEVVQGDDRERFREIVLGADQVGPIQIGIFAESFAFGDQVAERHAGFPFIGAGPGDAIALEGHTVFPDLDVLDDRDAVAIDQRQVLARRCLDKAVQIHVHVDFTAIDLETADLALFQVRIRSEAAGERQEFTHPFIADEFVCVGPEHLALDGHRFLLERHNDVIAGLEMAFPEVDIARQEESIQIHRLGLAGIAANLDVAQGPAVADAAGVVQEVDDIGYAGTDPVSARPVDLTDYENGEFLHLTQADIDKGLALCRFGRIDEGGVDA